MPLPGSGRSEQEGKREMSPEELTLEDVREAAPASDRRMRDFAEAASDWFWEVGPDLCFTYASDRLKDVTGVAPHELVGRSVEEFLAASPDREGAKRQRDVMRERRPFRDFIIPYSTRAGWHGHMRISGVPILADDGSFLGYRGCAADITAEIETRALAKRSDALLREAIESLPEGFTLYDSDERLVLCNSRYRDMYGLIKEALVPGAGLEELLQLAAQRRQVQFESAQAWVSERLRRFHNPGGPYEQVLIDGRYIRCTDYRTASGGTICLRADVTDLKLVEQRLRDAIGGMSDGFALYDPSDRLVMCNERFRDLHRHLCKAGDLVGRSFSELMRPLVDDDIIDLSDGESPEAWFARRLQHHAAPGQDPFLLRFGDGRYIEVREQRTAEGGRVSICIDITDRKRAEAALEEAKEAAEASERRTRDFAEAASDWFWEFGPDQHFTYVSDRLDTAVGYSAKKAVGRSVKDFLARVEDSGAVDRLFDVLRDQRPFKDVVLPFRTAGREGFLRLSGIPIRAEDGSFLGYRGIGADVTREVEARALAKRSEALLRDAIESLTEGFALYDADERLVLCNSRYRDIYPLTKHMVIPGIRVEELFQAAAQCRQIQFDSPEEWVADRLRRFRDPGGPFEQRLSDDRRIWCTDYRTASGGTICLRTDITDHRRAETALRESENKFKGFLTASPDAMLVVNETGEIVLASDRAMALFGYRQEELAGKPFSILIPERYRAAHLAHTVGYMAEPRVRNMNAGADLKGRRKDGSEFPAEISLSPNRTSEGLVVLAAIRDITQRNQAEQALRESRDGLERAQKIGRIGSVTVDLSTGKGVWSAQHYRQLGLDPAAAGSGFELFLSRVYPDDRQLLIDERARYMRGEEPTSFEYRIVRPTGETRWVRREAEIERDAAGRPVRLHATTQDITENKRAAEELAATQVLLKESEARYRSYFESSMDAQFLTLADGSTLEANTAACDMLGRSADEIKRLGRNGVVDVSDPRLHAFLRERARTGRVRAEFTMIRADGTKFPVEVASSSFADAAGRQIMTVSVRDLTERKRIEAQLSQAQKMEALGTLAGGIAHDLNNTLVPILVFTKLTVASLPEAGTERKHLMMVVEAAERAKDLVAQILAYSRSETTERTQIDMTRVVGEALKVVRAGISPTIELRTEITTDRLPILGNPTQIHQVVMNLCSNAAHAVGSKAGKITVVLRRERRPDEPLSGLVTPGYATLSVIDNGTGMNEATRQRIFDPFFTTKAVGEGTGLGLSIVHGVARTHGGTISVESHVGVGTRFDLSFPLIADNTDVGD